MNYKWHTRISLAVLIVVTLILELSQQYPVHEVILFWAMGYFNTVYASPDIDHKKSKPTQNMGAVGWVTSRVFTHRGLLHNPWFWTILYVFIMSAVMYQFNYTAWWIIGGLVAVFTHIVLDCVSTKTKRVKTKVRRKLHL